MKWISRGASDAKVRVQILARAQVLLYQVLSMKKLFLIILLGTLIAVPIISSARHDRGLVPCGLGHPAPDNVCQLCHVFILFQNILNFFLFPPPALGGPPTGGGIVFVLATLMVAVAGMYFIFSGGSSGNISRAKEILTGTAIALLIIYGSWLLINLFFLVIGVESWTGLQGGWFRIDCRI